MPQCVHFERDHFVSSICMRYWREEAVAQLSAFAARNVVMLAASPPSSIRPFPVPVNLFVSYELSPYNDVGPNDITFAEC